MSERERWIVYPLLFLALGAALRDKLFDITTSKRIVCQELTIVDEDAAGLRSPRPLARIGSTEGTSSGTQPVGYIYIDGQLEVHGPVVARQFVLRDLPYAPGILSILPRELWHAIQQGTQAIQGAKPPGANPPETQPPAGEPSENNVPATEPKSGQDKSNDESPE